MSCDFELPEELCALPMPFIVLTGLDITYNAIHRSIWDAFSNNRRHDRLSLSFSCLEGDHQYPQSKPKRMSYDWYIPKGLLKTGWMKKHLYEIPSLVVVFFELDWDDLAWRERHLACASRVEVVRSSLQGRTTKIAVVLIQKNSPLPPGEDMVAAERAAALCSACDLSAKSLFVLPHTDHLIGYIIRLENAFHELAQAYYHTECRRVKAHKEFLNKTTHQLLFPRHQFKIAFYSEMMQDPATALKHYQQSYIHIHELRLHDSNNLELKVVGGYVNYKICKLCFLKLNSPVDAISQFQHHIDLFKPLCGNKDLLFEHSAWLSKQFVVFADLFADAINAVRLTAVQTQHPGFYYLRGANYSQIRKRLALKIRIQICEQPIPNEDLLYCEKLEYYGQRPWRQGHQRIDLSDTSQEKEGILALQLQEQRFDHSKAIIPLLSSAISHFKKFHSPRMKRYIMIDMGKEYYLAKDFQKAMTLLARTTPDFRDGNWSLILTRVLVLLLDCAYITANIISYFTFSSELIGQLSKLSERIKGSIQKNILEIVSGKMPLHSLSGSTFDESFLDSEVIKSQKVLEKWNKELVKSSVPCTIEMENLKAFVDCKVVFAVSQSTVESCVQLFVCIFATCPKPIQFTELAVLFNNSNYDEFCIIKDGLHKSLQSQVLYYEPGKINVHTFEFSVSTADVSKTLSVQNVYLKIASENSDAGIPLTFKWKYSNSELDSYSVWTKSKLLLEDWNSINNRSKIFVSERSSNLNVDFIHNFPILTDEIFPIKLSICSLEDENIIAEKVNVIASLKPSSDDTLFQGTSLFADLETALTGASTKSAEIMCGTLETNEKKVITFYVKAIQVGTLVFAFQINYHVCGLSVLQSNNIPLKKINCTSSTTHEIKADVVNPFEFSAHITSMTYDSLSSININTPFLVITKLTSTSSWPVEISSFQPNLSKSWRLVEEHTNSTICIANGESVVDCFCVLFNNHVNLDSSLTLGSYAVSWKRKDSTILWPIISVLHLPNISIKPPSLQVTIDLPAFGTMQKPSAIKYFIENQTNKSKQLEIAYEASDAFLFSGPKLSKNFLPPLSSVNILFNVIPINVGFLELPNLKIYVCESQKDNLDNLFEHKCKFDTSFLPSHLTVKPADLDEK